MLRILQTVNIMDRAGLETMLMNYYRNIDRSVIQFDFITHRSQDGSYDEEIRDLGGRVYKAPRLYPHHLLEYYRYMRSFYKDHREYSIIHSHIDTMSYFPLKAAESNGIPVRIAHSHSSKFDKDPKFPIKYYARSRIDSVATHNCACGSMAGRFMFGDNAFKVIHNATDLERFRYNETIRDEMREHLRLTDRFVVGHVGRYCYIKNQSFLLDIFAEISKERDDAALLLVGKGPDEKKIRKKAESLGLEDKVTLLIDRPDVDRLYQTFDLIVMPSLFEGFPVVGVEAQANGLPYYVSDKVSSEIILTGSARQLPLEAGPKQWAKKILEAPIKRNEHASEELQIAGYDVKLEAKKLQDWYIEVFKEIMN